SVNTVAAMTYSQPKVSMTPVSAASATFPSPVGETRPHTTKAIASTPATPKTTLSRPGRPRRRRRGGGGAEVLEELLGRLGVLAHGDARRRVRGRGRRADSFLEEGRGRGGVDGGRGERSGTAV